MSAQTSQGVAARTVAMEAAPDRKKPGLLDRIADHFRRYWQLWILTAPALFFVGLFAYVPMWGIQLAFREFDPTKGLTGGKFVGFKYFNEFFHNPLFGEIMTNTVRISLWTLVMGFIFPIILALLINQIGSRKTCRRVLVGAQEAARKLGYILLTVNTGNDRELENQEIAALRQYRVDGFLYAMMYHRVVEIPAELEGSPTVVVDSEDENRKIPSIYPDDEMAGYDATNRLIQAGCKRIVYYGSSITIIAQGERFAGYRRALADAGIPFDEQLVVNVEEATNAASEAGRVFDEIKPDGIFCFNDVRATFIYEAARERSVGIGTDVSVISIDNQPLITDVLKPALTTLELPHYEMGFEAVHQLVAMIDDEAATESLARSEDSIRRLENGPMTPLRCRIIERDSIVS